MSHITGTTNHSSDSLRDFFTRKKKLQAAAAQGGAQEMSNRLSTPPVFSCPSDSIDVKPKSLGDKGDSQSKEFGSLLNGLHDAYGDDKDPKAEKGEKIKSKEPVKSKKFSKDASKTKLNKLVVAKKLKSLKKPIKK